MSFDYAATAATAQRLLLRFGAVCTLRRVTAGAYDPATGSATTTVSELSTVAVVLDYPQRYVDGTLIKQGDKQAFLDRSYAPAQGDELSWQGVTYQVVNYKAVSPAGVPVLYEAQLRGV